MTKLSHYVLTIETPDSPRLIKCKQTFVDAGIEPEFVQGIRGLTPEAQAVYSPWRNTLFYKYPMSPGEIACAFGHWRILKRFLATQHPVCAVYEDDVVLSKKDELRVLYEHAMADPAPSWDLLKLHDLFPSKIMAADNWRGNEITRYRVPPAGAAAYLVTRIGAQKILSRKHVFRPIDVDISHCWELNLRVRSVVPNPISVRDQIDTPSTLEYERENLYRTKSIGRSIKGELHGLYMKVAGRYLAS